MAATITSNALTAVNYSQSLAQTTTTLSASMDSNTAAITTTATVLAGVSGSVVGAYSLAISNGTTVTGFKVLNGTNGVTSSFIITADQFAVIPATNLPGQITRPFTILNNVVYIDSAVVTKMSVANLSAGTLSIGMGMGAGGSIRSGKTSYIDTTPGFWLANSNTVQEFAIGNASNYMKWDSVVGVLNLSSAISGGSITGTTITGTSIVGGTISGGAISGGTITGTTISGTTINGGTINGGTITGADLIGGTLTIQGSGGVNFSYSTMQNGGDSGGIGFEIGYWRVGAGSTHIDFHTVAGGVNRATAVDYSARITRDSGPDSEFHILQSGSGDFLLWHIGTGGAKIRFKNESFLGSGIGTVFEHGIQASSYDTPSSIRYKTNVTPIKNSLKLIESLNGVNFDWKDGRKYNDIGFIAEEVNEIIPQVVTKNENGTVESLDYTRIVSVLVEAVKELSAEVKLLKAKPNG